MKSKYNPTLVISALLILVSCLTVLFSACTFSTKKEKIILNEGIWRGVLKPQGIEVPFLFNVKESEGKYSFILMNGKEKMMLDNVIINNDSLHVQLFVFNSTIHAKINNNKLHGIWVKNDIKDFVIPFIATFGDEQRFKIESEKPIVSFDGKWEVDFIKKNNSIEKAIGLFSQNGQKLTGTFLTSTGDYRYLEGVVKGNSMKLSSFDGVNALLFEAKMLKNGELTGELWNLTNRHEKWTAKRNDNFELKDTYAVTFMKEGYDIFNVELPNTSGELISLSNKHYKDKVVVVQILGTWCPNCIDETRFLVDWHKKNKDKGVEILGLAFEKKSDTKHAILMINKWKEKLGIDYEILLAGVPKLRSETLPMLNDIVTFPTTIILDKQHKVRLIKSGFFGPGSTIYYEEFVKNFNLTIDKLVEE
jgi:thiol-disulfide isomerase/thioredoxin